MVIQEVNLGRATFSSDNTAINVGLSASICIEYDARLSVRVAAPIADAFDPRKLLLLQGQSLPFLIVLSFEHVLNIATADLESYINVIEKAFSDYSVWEQFELVPRCATRSDQSYTYQHGPAPCYTVTVELRRTYTDSKLDSWVDNFDETEERSCGPGQVGRLPARLKSVTMRLDYHVTSQIMDTCMTASAAEIKPSGATGSMVDRREAKSQTLDNSNSRKGLSGGYAVPERRSKTHHTVDPTPFSRSAINMLKLADASFKFLACADRPRGCAVSLVQDTSAFLHLSEVAPVIFEVGYRRQVDQRTDLLRPITKCLAAFASFRGIADIPAQLPVNHDIHGDNTQTRSGMTPLHDNIKQHLSQRLRTGLFPQNRRKRIAGLPRQYLDHSFTLLGVEDTLGAGKSILFMGSIDEESVFDPKHQSLSGSGIVEWQTSNAESGQDSVLMTTPARKAIRQQQPNQRVDSGDSDALSDVCLVDAVSECSDHGLVLEAVSSGISHTSQQCETHRDFEIDQEPMHSDSVLAWDDEDASTYKSPDEDVLTAMICWSDQLTQPTSRTMPEKGNCQSTGAATLDFDNRLYTVLPSNPADEAPNFDCDVLDLLPPPKELSVPHTQVNLLSSLEDIYERSSEHSETIIKEAEASDTGWSLLGESHAAMTTLDSSQNNHASLTDVLGNDHGLWHMWNRRASIYPPNDEQILELKSMYENDPDM